MEELRGQSQGFELIVRLIDEKEIEVLNCLLKQAGSGTVIDETAMVRDLDDGGMGSIQIIHNEPSVFGKKLVDAEYVDADGVTVSLGINLDQFGRVYELDFWKVDFSKLLKYPRPDELKSITLAN